MLRLFYRKKKPIPGSAKHEGKKTNDLSDSVTEVALEIIQGDDGTEYHRCMKKLFNEVPELVEDVDPQYRDALIKELRRNEE